MLLLLDLLKYPVVNLQQPQKEIISIFFSIVKANETQLK